MQKVEPQPGSARAIIFYQIKTTVTTCKSSLEVTQGSQMLIAVY